MRMLRNLFDRAAAGAPKVSRVAPDKERDGTNGDNGTDNSGRWNGQEAGTDGGSEKPDDEADPKCGVAPGLREQEVANALSRPDIWDHSVTTLCTGWHVNC
jgi:hypothetical protein